jgi:hypothetical protein
MLGLDRASRAPRGRSPLQIKCLQIEDAVHQGPFRVDPDRSERPFSPMTLAVG